MANVLYGYVPSGSLLASVKIVADTVKKIKSMQLPILTDVKGWTTFTMLAKELPTRVATLGGHSDHRTTSGTKIV